MTRFFVRTLLVATFLGAAGAAHAADEDITLSLVASDPSGGYDGVLSPDGRYVVASSTRSGVASLWLFDRERGTWDQLTDDEGEDTEPAFSPDGSKIAFTSWRGDEKNIWLLTLADRSIEVVTPGPEEEEYAAFSPDGQRLVFTGGPWKARNFYLHDLETGTSKALMKAPDHVGACSFHPAGTKVVCHTYTEGYGDLVEVALETGEVTSVTSGSDWHYKPSVNASASMLAFTRIGDDDEIHIASLTPGSGRIDTSRKIANGRWPQFGSGGRELFFHRLVEVGSQVRIVNRRTGDFEVLVDAERKPAAASLSPDGTQVAYCSKAGDAPAVWIHDRVTGNARKLELGGYPACFPAFSPDGKRIAVTLRVGGKWEIATIATDASEPLTVWTDGDPGLKNLDAPVAFSPDGQRLAFAARTAPYESDLYVLHLQDGKIANVTRDAWFDEGPSFSPDGDKLLFMSTRGGDWTWTLYELSLSSGELRPFTEPDWVEKGYPFRLADGTDMWVETNSCLSSTFVVERDADDNLTYLQAHAGARWATPSADGEEILFTISSRRTEYWVANMPERAVTQ